MPTMPKVKRAPWMPEPKKAWQHTNRWDGYNSTRWREASATFKTLNPVCSTPGCSGATAATDHKANVAGGHDPWDQANWQPLCHDCHRRKTASEGGHAAAGRTADKGRGASST